MRTRNFSTMFFNALFMSIVMCFSAEVLAVDEEAAQSLLKKSKCLTCHSVDKTKDGPSYKKVAAKYQGDATAKPKLFKHLTEKSMVEIDGEEEEHGIVKTRDEDKINNLIEWILSR